MIDFIPKCLELFALKSLVIKLRFANLPCILRTYSIRIEYSIKTIDDIRLELVVFLSEVQCSLLLFIVELLCQLSLAVDITIRRQ